MSRIGELLERGHAEAMFSGAAWSVGTAEGELDAGHLGTLADGGEPVGADTLWDLASVTKPIAGLAAMSLVDSGDLLLDDPVAMHLPDFAGSDKAASTVRELLTHTSGIPGQVPLYRWCHTRDELIDAIRLLPRARPPGTEVIYSSQGFILLGLIIEAVTGARLDEVVRSRVTAPAGMTWTRFLLPEADRHRAAATEDCPWRGQIVQGTVHDENAQVLGGVAAHAGLFATLADVARLGRTLCADAVAAGGTALLSPAAHATMIATATDALNLRRCLAWQGRDRVDSPAGDLLGTRTYGHTGFTGTSLWVDPELGGYVVLLTNRVHPTREPRGFDRVRRLVHNAAAALLSGRTRAARG